MAGQEAPQQVLQQAGSQPRTTEQLVVAAAAPLEPAELPTLPPRSIQAPINSPQHSHTRHHSDGQHSGWRSRKNRRRGLALALLVALSCWWVLAASLLAQPRADVITPTASLEQSASTQRWRRGWGWYPAAAWGHKQPPKVALQIGHEGVQDHPEELKALRWNTGGYAAGVNEIDINRAVVSVLQSRLEAVGIEVEVLTATPPVHYRADMFLSIHADSVTDARRHGYKSAYFEPLRNNHDAELKAHIDKAYLKASRLADDSINISPTMREFYAFNHQLYKHSVHPDTPSLIVEMGYISNDHDRAYLQKTSEPADALFKGIMSYLEAQGQLPKTPKPTSAQAIRIPELQAEVMRLKLRARQQN